MRPTSQLPSLPSFTSLSRSSSTRSIPPAASLKPRGSFSSSSSSAASSFSEHHYPGGFHQLEQRSIPRPPASASFYSAFGQEVPASEVRGCGIPPRDEDNPASTGGQGGGQPGGESGSSPPPPPPPPPPSSSDSLPLEESGSQEDTLLQMEHEQGDDEEQQRWCRLEDEQTRSCYYLLAPIRREVWADFLFFLLISPLLTAFQLAWGVTTLLLGLVLTVLIPPMGLALLCLAAMTWRQLARFDLMLLRLLGGTWQKVPPLPALSKQPVWDRGALKFIWEWTAVLLGSPTSWVCLVYFVLLKPAAVATCVAGITSVLFVSLVLIVNLFLTLAASDTMTSDDWSNLTGFEWIFNTPVGSVVTLPLGLLIFWGITMALIPLGRLYKRVVPSVLTKCEHSYKQF